MRGRDECSKDIELIGSNLKLIINLRKSGLLATCVKIIFLKFCFKATDFFEVLKFQSQPVKISWTHRKPEVEGTSETGPLS